MKVEARKYRFRMLNSCNLRIFILCLNDGSQVTQIGSDGGLLPAPAATPVLVLSPGERADFVVDFSKYAPGTQLTLQNMLGPGPTELVGQIMRFDVGEKTPDTSRVPDVLTTLPALPKPTVERSFELRMDEPGTGDKAYINGKTFDAGRIDTNIKWGDTEVMDGHEHQHHDSAQLPYAPGAVPHSRTRRAAGLSGGGRPQGHRAALSGADGQTPAHLRHAQGRLSLSLPHDRPQRHGNDGANEDRLNCHPFVPFPKPLEKGGS